MSLRNGNNKIYPVEDDHDENHSNHEEQDVYNPQTSHIDKEEQEMRLQLLDHVRKDTIHSEVTLRLSNLTHFSQDEEWPALIDDQAAIKTQQLRRLPSTNNQIRDEASQRGKITVRSVTWNQHAQPFPGIELLRKYLLPHGYYHIIAIGTQECENSISKSILYPSKENWERLCSDALGMDYEFIRGHSLQASHL
jgi:hypothetical protein